MTNQRLDVTFEHLTAHTSMCQQKLQQEETREKMASAHTTCNNKTRKGLFSSTDTKINTEEISTETAIYFNGATNKN